jgi:hypothetical protein
MKLKLISQSSILAATVALTIVTAKAQPYEPYNSYPINPILTPVGVSQIDPTAVSVVVGDLPDLALGENATNAVNVIAGFGILPGGPGTAVATSDDSIGGTQTSGIFGPQQAINGVICTLSGPGNWQPDLSQPANGNFYPWLPVDQSESGTFESVPPIQENADWLVIDFTGTNATTVADTIGMIVIEGRFQDRDGGLYTFQYTTDAPPVSNAGSTWTTIGSYSFVNPTPYNGFNDVLPRLAFVFPAIPNVTGIQLLQQATNHNGIWGCSVQQLEVYGPFTKAPVITQQPEGTNGLVGLPVTLSVTAANGVGFQWYKNSQPVGPNNNTFVVSAAAQTNDSGTYSVVVSNSFGSIVSSNAVVSIEFPPAPELIQQSGVILSYTPVANYVFTLQNSPTLTQSQFADFSTWFTTVNGQTLTATPIEPGDQFFRLEQTTP